MTANVIFPIILLVMAERKDLKDLLRDTDFTQKRIIDDLATSEIDTFPERGVGRDIRRSEGGDLIKNFLVGVLLVAIVVGSFWISFLLGKKVLVPPVKNLQTMQPVESAAPKPVSKSELESATPVQGEEEAPIPEKEIKAVEKKEGLPKPIMRAAPKASEAIPAYATTPAAPPSKGSYYKIIVGNYATMADAKRVTTVLKARGFQSYTKRTAAGYRVQAGAVQTRAQALPIFNKLKAKGFTPSIIVE